jgi:hypothetical protein
MAISGASTYWGLRWLTLLAGVFSQHLERDRNPYPIG